MSVFHNNALIGAGGGAAAADAAVATKSLRFNSDDSAHLSKTYSSAGNRKKWTWSAWVKLCSTSTGRSRLFGVSGANTGSPYNFATNIGFNDNKICFTNHANDVYSTDAVFRDYSAWYHIVVALDTTDATTANRVKIYVNGVLQDKTHPGHGGAAEPSQNTEYAINSTLGPHTLGASPDTSGTAELFFDGYMADIHFIDGSALAPTSFGAYDSSGVWQAATYSGTYGTNGFHLLDFANESTIGHDSSGNNNDFTANNLSNETTTLPGVNFTSSTSDHLDHPASTDFNFTGDFTTECYVKITAYNASGASTIAGTGSNGWSFGLTNAGKVSFGHYGVQGFFSGGASVLEGVWTHVAVTRSGSSVKGFINGVEEVSTTYSTSMSNTNELYIGNDVSNSSQHFNGVISNLNIVQGTALYTSNFSPPTTPLSAHTNTKLLCCQSSSSTTAAAVAPGTLTANGSVTAGNFTDSGFNTDVLFDVPTNDTENTDSGAGGEISGNYATLNPLQNGLDLSNGNLSFAIGTRSDWKVAAATIHITSGKWFWEITNGTQNTAGGNIIYGLRATDAGSPLATTGGTTAELGYNDGNKGYMSSALKRDGGSGTTSYGATFGTSDVIGVAFDADAGSLVFYKNGVSQGTAFTGLTGSWAPAVALYTGGTQLGTDNFNINFGQRPFAYSAPSNHKCLVSTNLPTPTIADGSDYFDTKIYTGNGSSQTISGFSFSPDFAWFKNRATTKDPRITDIIMGTGKELYSSGTSGEFSQAQGVTAFNSDGVSVGSDGGYNGSSQGMVLWAWDAGSSNTSVSVGGLNSSAYNQDQTWSTYGSVTAGTFSPTIAELFDNDVTTGPSTGANTTATWTFTAAVTAASSIHIYAVNGSGPSGTQASNTEIRLTVDGVVHAIDGAPGLINTGLKGDLTAITINVGQSGSPGLRYIKVDDEELVDSGITVANVPTIASTVRANPSAGFSIVTFTNTTSDSTVGHGLNAKPDMIIWKKTSGTSHWPIYHSALGATKYMYLNLTNGATTGSEFWNNTEPDSNVITTKGEPNSMGSAGDTVMYVFTAVAGYSAFGSADTNGTTDNAFIYLGFRAKFIMFKRTDSTGNWTMWDTSRNTFNVMNKYLFANSNIAEGTDSQFDILSNGIKLRTTGFASGGTFAYAAFAENPFQANGGLAR